MHRKSGPAPLGRQAFQRRGHVPVSGEERPRSTKGIRCRSPGFRGNHVWVQTLALHPMSLCPYLRNGDRKHPLASLAREGGTRTAATTNSVRNRGCWLVKGKRVVESQEAGTAAKPGEGSQVLPEPRQNGSCQRYKP